MGCSIPPQVSIWKPCEKVNTYTYIRGTIGLSEQSSRLQSNRNSTAGSQRSRHLHVDGGQQDRGRDIVTHSTVEVGQNSDNKRAKGVGNRRARSKLLRRVEIDGVASQGNKNHDGHLLPLCLDCEEQEEDVARHKKEGPVLAQRVLTCCGCHCIRVYCTVQGRADRDAITKEERVDDGIHHADGARYNGLGMEFKRRR